jgi:hypothetical protein
MRRLTTASALSAPLAAIALALTAAPASATPVCTDGYKGGPPAAACGGRIFPEAAISRSYVQFNPDATGFREFQHGIEYLAMKYPRYASVTTLDALYGPTAVSIGKDRKRAGTEGDTNDGLPIHVLKITDNSVPDKRKKALFFSLSVHGNERGGLEGGLRTAEDLAMDALSGGRIVDGYDNFESTTGKDAELRSFKVSELLKQQVIYLVDFNPDGWAVGDFWATPFPALYSRGNANGTDLNRQMPTVGRINPSRNPLQENEMRFGKELMDQVARDSAGGKAAYGADIHGELTSQAYMDVMYPAGQFDSVDHRRLMAIAERTKSVIDKTLFAGIQDEIENADGGDGAQGTLKNPGIPTKPAHWATVWDTLGYTDTGFIGDYLATDVGVTGMDYEIAFNHTVPEKVWNVYLQENHINASRGIIKTAMAYAMSQETDFNEDNVVIDTLGRAGYVDNPDTVTDKDENGAGTLPGPKGDGIGQDGQPVKQASYEATNMRFFEEQSRLLSTPFAKLSSDEVARGQRLDGVDTLVLADVAVPVGRDGKPVDEAAYWSNLKRWVDRGGNLVLTDRALHGLGSLGVVAADKVRDISVYQPYANFRDLGHPLADGIRSNGRQLVEAPALGYGIGNNASPMTVVNRAAFEAAGGKTVATTGNNSGSTDPQTDTSIGEVRVGKGKVRIIGGALPMPTEQQDHRFGLRDYAMTYTGLFTMENALKHDAPGLGIGE